MSELPIDRREFHGRLTQGIAFLGVCGAVARVSADDGKTSLNSKNDEPKADDPSGDVEAMTPAELIVELTRQRFPHERMSEDFLSALRSYVELNFTYSETFDNFGLTNADPPGPIMYFPERQTEKH